MATVTLAALALLNIRRQAAKGGAEEIDPYNLIVSDKPESRPIIKAGLCRDSASIPTLGESSGTRTAAERQLHAEREVSPATTSLAAPPSSPPPYTGALPPPALQSHDDAAGQVLSTSYHLGVPGTQIASLGEK